ncbi:CBS domain-containing protein [Algoriphagus alkaliphilus]|uniref:CBS domain-containing protein n=1 Tax=Algoriphagus alkaliphilus TaxID=279824 RepID=A0A1G5XVT5_9BACT|nr:CBS domain-containing protein [Algoriphagus alkaliphilus]SDA73755.1 CBS domain-containing protein [Algoriphagus alkaliphilus]
MSSSKSAKDIASLSLYYIDGLASVREAINLMKENQVDYLFIKKRNEQDANGIIVISDIIRGVIAKDLKPEEVSVYEIMTKPALSISSNLNSKYVSRLLLNSKINVAPVEENGNYIGVIHLRDIVYSY